jgi:hypothetical protein
MFLDENFAFKGMQEKQNIQVTKRWVLYTIIVLNIVTIVFLSVFSVVALYYGIYCYEGTTVIDNLFYKNKAIGNFSAVPNGEIIDLCTSGGNIDSHFNFSKYYYFYEDLINEGIEIEKTYKNNPSTQSFDDFYTQVNSMNITSFEAIEDRKIKWDLDGEQINYFLYPLKGYKYFNTRIFILKLASRVLVQYIDIEFESAIYTNYQLKYCNNGSLLADTWASTKEKCSEDWPGYNYTSFVSSQKTGNRQCYSIKSPESNCLPGDPPSCYIYYYTKRYSAENDFTTCDSDKALMGEGSTAKDWFQNNIGSLLLYAKNEDYNRADIESMLGYYQTNFTNLINTHYSRYRTELRKAYDYYITLIPVFTKLRNYFKFNEVMYSVIAKNTILTNTDCSYMKRDSQVFFLLKQLVAEEIFGIGLLNMIRIILLFVNVSCLVILLLKLRSHIEIQKIKRDMQTSIAKKKVKEEIEVNAVELKDTIKTKVADETMIDQNKSEVTCKSNRKLIYTYDLQEHQYGKIVEFLKQQDKDVEGRLEHQGTKNI